MFLHVSDSVHWRGWGGIPACIAGFQAHTQGEVEESGQGGSQGPHLGRGLLAHTWKGLQAHTWGGWSPGLHPGKVSRPTPGGCVCQHALRQIPPSSSRRLLLRASHWNVFLLEKVPYLLGRT